MTNNLKSFRSFTPRPEGEGPGLRAEGKRYLWLLIPPLLLLTWLGAHSLNADLLWLDEYFSVGNVGGILRVSYNPAEVWWSVSQYSPQHPPGYFMLLSGWVALTGWTPFAMRALSLLAAVLTVVLTYRLGAEWLSPRAGLYAAYILSVSALFVYYAHELRMYTLMALLTVWTLWVYRRVIQPNRQPKRWEWTGLFIGAAGLIWIHYVSIVPVAAVGLYHLLLAPKNRRWLWVSLVLGAACLSFLAWLNVLLVGARFINVEEDTGTAVLGPLGVASLLIVLFTGGMVALLIPLVFTLPQLRRRGVRDVWFFALAILGFTLLINAITPMINVNRARYLIHLWPLLALLAGLSLTVLERIRFLPPVLLIAWLGFGISSTLNPAFLGELDGLRYVAISPPLREIIREANRVGDDEDMLISFSRERYLLNEVKFGPVAEFYLRELRIPSHWITLPDERPSDEIEADIRGAVGTRMDVWLAYEPVLTPETLMPYREALDADYVRCETSVTEPNFVIEHYALAAFGCLPQSEAQVALFGDGITLREVRLAGEGDELLIAAGWSVSESVPPETYSVSFKLWNAAGDFVTQADNGLRASGFGWQLAKLPVGDVPAGEYRLTATVYDWRSGATLKSREAAVEIVPVTDVRLPFVE
jgi:hypothetical protein